MLRAIDHHHDRVVWLGVRPARSAAERRELLQLAQDLLSLVPHPGLPIIRDDFFDGERHVLVRDWVEGTPLSRLLAERGDPGLPPSAVQRWLGQAADVLDHLRRQRPPVAHGAVSPAHLVLTDDGRLMVVNGGLGALGARSAIRPWLAPEIAAGGPATPAGDVYGLAATALTLLTGVQDVADARSWDGVDPALVKVAQRALRRGLDADPARRPESARELVERLSHAYEADLPTGEVTFCLTDVEESTPQWENNPDGMQAAMTRLRDLIADLVDEHGGRLPRSQGEGDSTLSVFPRPSSARGHDRRRAPGAGPGGLARGDRAAHPGRLAHRKCRPSRRRLLRAHREPHRTAAWSGRRAADHGVGRHRQPGGRPPSPRDAAGASGRTQAQGAVETRRRLRGARRAGAGGSTRSPRSTPRRTPSRGRRSRSRRPSTAPNPPATSDGRPIARRCASTGRRPAPDERCSSPSPVRRESARHDW